MTRIYLRNWHSKVIYLAIYVDVSYLNLICVINLTDPGSFWFRTFALLFGFVFGLLFVPTIIPSLISYLFTDVLLFYYTTLNHAVLIIALRGHRIRYRLS